MVTVAGAVFWTILEVALTAGAAIGALVLVRRARLARVVAGALGLAGLVAAVVTLGAAVPDELGRLPREQRRIAEQALDGGRCGGDLATITRIEVSAGGQHVEWSCRMTILPWPSFSGQSDCVDGSWYLTGWRDPQFGSDCVSSRAHE